MHTYLRNKPAWQQLIIFVGLTVGIFVVTTIVGIFLVAQANHLSASQVVSMKASDYANPALVGVIRGMLIIQFFGMFFIPSLLFAYLADPHPLNYAGIRKPTGSWLFLLAIGTMILGYLTVVFLGKINESIVHYLPKSIQQWIERGEADANGTLENILVLNNPTDLVRALFLVGFLPAVGEELFFRGILQKIFIQIFRSAWPGIIFTAFLFSAIHMQFMGFLPRMALGVILGALCWYSGSIYTSMLGHFIFNSINIVLIYYKLADLDSKATSSIGYSLLGLASMAGVILLLKFLKKNSTITYSSEFPHPAESSLFDDSENPA